MCCVHVYIQSIITTSAMFKYNYLRTPVASLRLGTKIMLCLFLIAIMHIERYTNTHTRHPRLFKDVFFAYVLIVFQPLLGAVLVHSLCCNTTTDILFPLRLIVRQPLLVAVFQHSLCCNAQTQCIKLVI